MRSLSRFRWLGSSSSWSKHQQKCISDAVESIQSNTDVADPISITPLIPGARLFNQMLMSDQQSSQGKVDAQPAVSSLDPVYESLSYPMQWPQGATILVDVNVPDQWCLETLRETVVSHCENGDFDSPVESLVVLQGHQLTELKNTFADFPIRVQSLHPDWCNTAQMLAYYRSALHTIFINTSRVADAAFCGIDSTLICNQTFIESLKTDALMRVLSESPTCKIHGESPFLQSDESPVYSVIDNRIADLNTALSQMPVQKTEDWLSEYRVSAELNKPVIDDEIGWRKKAQAIIDTRITLRRKGQKLQEDPKQFCIDSRNPMLRALGRLLPSRVTV